jgi:hypothetical protein
VDLDEILAELTQIRDRIAATSDSEERTRLETRRQELRRMAREEVPPSRAELRAELQRLESAWDRLQKTRIDPVKQAGGGSIGGDFGFAADAVRINQQIDSAAGRADLERRIMELRTLLDDDS